MELHENSVRDKRTIEVFVRNLPRAIPEGRTEETEIFAISKWGTKIDRSGSRRSGNSSNQYEKDLLRLLSVLKSKYPFRVERNKDVLYDDEIERFTALYGITNVYPVLLYHNSIFWLQNPDGVYLWSRIDDRMIHGG
ncbi:13850_t:CDS:2, partial [Rhizophagus irregularis]